MNLRLRSKKKLLPRINSENFFFVSFFFIVSIALSINDVFWASFIRLKVVKRISRTYFVFSDNKPTHFKLLETIYLDYSNRLARYIRNSKVNRAKQEQETKIAEAVKFLKSFGFQIYAPVEDLYSKL